MEEQINIDGKEYSISDIDKNLELLENRDVRNAKGYYEGIGGLLISAAGAVGGLVHMLSTDFSNVSPWSYIPIIAGAVLTLKGVRDLAKQEAIIGDALHYLKDVFHYDERHKTQGEK